ncbi:hypothetical protein [Micromonospora sp. DT233]|uniref:hypothetical protein n=1 Tax=Micromonospora sp. DT233 TaxID=3393432 RepID=UPI003CE7D3FA
MRWLRQVLGRKESPLDPGRQEALLHDVRQRFGAGAQAGIAQQVDEVTRLLDGDDGLVVAGRIVGEAAEGANAELLAQAFDLHRRTGRRLVVDRRNYRPLWQAAGRELRWPFYALPGGFHPYVQVTAAVTAIGGQAPQVARVTDPYALLTHLFEVLDLTVVGWEYGRVRVDVDAARLVERLIATARELRAAMDEQPPLPPPVRELMRRNNTVAILDPAADRVVGGVNLGAELRVGLLV